MGTRAAPRLADTASALARYLTVTELLLARRDAAARIGTRLAPDSAPPWNGAVAAVVFGIHADARRAEAELCRAAGLPARPRPGSGTATRKALEAVGKLAIAAGDQAAEDAAWILEGWIRAAQRLPAIDEIIQWVPVRRACTSDDCPAGPRQHSHSVPCEYCGTPSLRAAPVPGLLMCCYPSCRDGDDRRPLARLDISRLTAEPVLAWRDGHVQPVIVA